MDLRVPIVSWGLVMGADVWRALGAPKRINAYSAVRVSVTVAFTPLLGHVPSLDLGLPNPQVVISGNVSFFPYDSDPLYGIVTVLLFIHLFYYYFLL